MIKHIKHPAIIKAAGNKEKIIEEYFGRVNSGASEISIAKMESPEGWIEPGQEPEFDEYTLVLKGSLEVKTKSKSIVVNEGEAILIQKNQWVQYSSPFKGGAEYIAICLPAFAPDIVHRDDE
ncbi:MAG: cupin domain-containing protein [Chloroflexia bacterium]|nr:cupin domain-containing protein [Chloroflexia bacterium]